MRLDSRLVPPIVAALCALLVLGVAGWADGYARHGYTASWYARSPTGDRIETARTTEHRVVIPNDHRPMARMIEGWDFRRLGIPADVPPIDATLRGVIRVPAGGRYLHATASGTTTIRVDGTDTSTEMRVGPGFHRVEVDWQATLEPTSFFQLEWGPAPDATERIPREAIWPTDGDFPPLRRALWIAALALAAIASWLGYRITKSDEDVRRRLVHATLVVALVCTGMGFRLIDHGVMPDWRDNDDERFACWNGYSLLTEGRPRALTIWPDQYVGLVQLTVHPYFGRVFHVISPYFEHPPLMHLLVGAVGVAGGAREFREVRLSEARLVPILLSGITIALIIAIGRRLERRRSAAPYVGALLYAVLPWIVLQTRVIKEESLLTPLSVATFWLFLRWKQDKRDRDLILAAILAGLCPLAKVPGAGFILALAVLVMREAGPRVMVRQLLISAPIALLWPLFGLVYGWRTFAVTQAIQTLRMLHFNVFLRFFDDAMINTIIIGQGWLLFLWLGSIGAWMKRSRETIAMVGTPLVGYLMAIGLGSGDWTYGWYITPMLPWICLGAGMFVVDAWREPDIVRGAILTVVLLFYSLNFAFSPEWIRAFLYHVETRWLVTSVLLLGWGPFAVATAMPSPLSRNVARAAIVAILAVVVVQSALFVYRWDEFQQIFGSFDRNRHFGL